MNRTGEVAKRTLLAAALWLACSPLYGQARLFEIVRGKDRPVCQAYVSALENMADGDAEFRERPWCPRNLNPSVEGFPPLDRTYITDLDKLITLRYRIESFMRSQDQYVGERAATTGNREAYRRETESAIKYHQLAMWRYAPQLDIDNDGKGDNVLWYTAGRCDSSGPISTALVIADPPTLAIDEDETRRLFGDPRPYPIKTERFIQLHGGTLGVFRYRKRDYIYAWGDDAAWKKERSPRTTARIYFRQRDKLSTICEVRWNEATR